MTLVEIDEIDEIDDEIEELQKGTMGQNLHRRMTKMRMKMTILEVSAQRRAQLDHQGTGTEAEDKVPR